MLFTCDENHLPMDLSSDVRPASLPVSRKSSQSQHDSRAILNAQNRVAYGSQLVPAGLTHSLSIMRPPLAPLHPQISTSNLVDRAMAQEEETHNGRKPSITLINATRPFPFSQRYTPRRSFADKRRTSLPVLHPTPDALSPDSAHPSEGSVSPLELVNVHDYDADIYSRLSTFTFGDAQSYSKPLSADDLDSVPPFLPISNSDKTPRPSVAYTQATGSYNRRSQYWDGSSEDEDEKHRTSTRSKMRAIDDGSRRPSRPSNDAKPPDYVSYSEKKGKAISNEDEVHHDSSSSSRKEAELDTDIYVTSADDNDKRRPTKRKGKAKACENGISSSDVSSVFGDDEFELALGRTNAIVESEGGSESLRSPGVAWIEQSGRRGSTPIAIPQASSSHQPRPYTNHVYSHSTLEFNELALAQSQVRRPSRSVDDDVFFVSSMVHRKASRASVHSSVVPTSRGSTFGADMSPASEPDMRSVAMAQAIAQAQLHSQAERSSTVRSDSGNSQAAIADSPYQGLDLDYILSFPSATGPTTHVNVGKPGIEGWNAASLSDNVNSVHGRDRNPSWIAGWNVNFTTGRRQSTATVNDDTFLRFVKKHDDSYEKRKQQWTFMQERTDDAVIEHRSSQMWRCSWVGRYRVDRVQSKNGDPSKPPQTRLNVRHIHDPNSKTQPISGPVSFIHKHSRVMAFSIFRGHTLPHRHLKTSSSILLAPKRVQEQFTTTRTTSKLSTHGLLEEKHGDHNVREAGRLYQTTSGGSTSSISAMPQSSKNVSSAKSEAFGSEGASPQSAGKLSLKSRTSANCKIIDVFNSTMESTRSPGREKINSNDLPSSWISSEPDGQDTPRILHTLGFTPFDPSSSHVSNRPISLVTEDSLQFSSVISGWDASSLVSAFRDPHHQFNSREYRMSVASRGSRGSLDDPPPIRTSHAEAFAALDPPFIEYLRMHSAHYEDGSGNESQPSRFRGFRKLFQSQALRSPKHGSQIHTANAAVLEGHYEPPWLIMAARSKQEEQERIIKNLNDSFRDVGLLPSFKPNRSRQTRRSKHTTDGVFDQIPDDSLYMLLPMWPGETDSASANASSNLSVDIPINDRKYLLVYYVPNELYKEKIKTQDKKRTRGVSATSLMSHHLESGSHKEDRNVTIALSSFNVLARLVSYKDIHGSGIRIPTNGLAVSGPLEEAMGAIPHMRFASDDLSLILAFCASRDRGVEVVPEGAEKLGLCLPRTSPDPDLDAPLSSLGRAAVEMAWLGALAVMGIGSAS